MITLHKGQYLSDVMSEIPSNCILSNNHKDIYKMKTSSK